MAYESGLHIRLAVHTDSTAQRLAQQAAGAGIHILPVSPTAAYADNKAAPEILLSFAGIAEDDIEPALQELQKVWGL